MLKSGRRERHSHLRLFAAPRAGFAAAVAQASGLRISRSAPAIRFGDPLLTYSSQTSIGSRSAGQLQFLTEPSVFRGGSTPAHECASATAAQCCPSSGVHTIFSTLIDLVRLAHVSIAAPVVRAEKRRGPRRLVRVGTVDRGLRTVVTHRDAISESYSRSSCVRKVVTECAPRRQEAAPSHADASRDADPPPPKASCRIGARCTVVIIP